MKIAILSPFYPYRGGIAQFSANIYDALRKEHEVIPYNFSRQYPSFLFPGKTQYVTDEDNAQKVDSIRILDSANPFSYAKTAAALRKERPDMLLMRYWMPYFAPSLGYIARHVAPETKVVAIVDNIVPHEQRFIDRPLNKYFVGGVDGFVAMSDVVRRDLLDLKPDAKHIVIPHPLYSHFGDKMDRVEACRALGLDPNKKTLLFFGLIREYKGLDILIKAMEMLDSSYQLLIAGEPYGSFQPYQDLIDISSHKTDIHCFTHYIDDASVALYFSASDVCVLPYRSATQSGIAAVSYHFDMPMITTDVGGLKEAVADTGTGIVVNKPTPEDIVQGITEYFESSDLQAFKNSIAELKEKLSWGNFAAKLVDFADGL